MMVQMLPKYDSFFRIWYLDFEFVELRIRFLNYICTDPMWAAKPPLASNYSAVVAQGGVMLTMRTGLGGFVGQCENLVKYAHADNKSLGSINQMNAKMPVLDPLNKSLFRMLTLQPQTRPGCHLK